MQLLHLSSIAAALDRHKHYLQLTPGKAPSCSQSLSSMLVTAKVMALITILHMYVDEEKEPAAMLEDFEKYLTTFGADNDADMLMYLVTSIITPLLGCCDVLDDSNKDMVDSTRSCLEAIQSMSTWLTFIYHRAQLLLVVSGTTTAPANVTSITRAIVMLGNPKFSSLVLKSFTRVLKSIITSLPRTHSEEFPTALLKSTFRSVLVTMKAGIGLIHTGNNSKNAGEGDELMTIPVDGYDDAFKEFRDFLVSVEVDLLKHSIFLHICHADLVIVLQYHFIYAKSRFQPS